MTVDDFIIQEAPDYRPKWKCTKCGACCNAVWARLPELDRGDGACKHLMRDNTCEIYEDRPKPCVVTEEGKKNVFVLARACDRLKVYYDEPRIKA